MARSTLRSLHSPEYDYLPQPLPQPRRHLVAVPVPPDPTEVIPDPSDRFLFGLAARAFEVIEGNRNVAQLGSAVTVGVSRQLLAQRSALNERRSIYRDHRRKLVGAGRVRICRVLPGVAEASVLLHTERRSHAVAIRVEWVHSRWRACELIVL